MSTKPAKKKVYQKDSQAILPQPVNDPSIIESVAGFIHEVVPQAYSSILPGDTRESILWARFDLADLNDPDLFPKHVERETDLPLPTLLVLGYATGVQVWSISGNGEATELLSWCQGTVRTLRFLLRPLARDHHLSKRPIVAIIDSSSPGPQYSTLSFVSLKTAEIVKIIKFNSAICDVLCNRKYIVVTFNGRIAIFDSATLEDKCTITKCYRSSDISPNPIALGTRWLAYADSELGTRERSSGGYVQDSDQSYTSVVLHAAKSLSQGIIGFGGSLSGNTQQASQNAQPQPGIVSVVDIEKRCGNNSRNNLVAHFVAHLSEVVAMAFDPSGLLLVTADINGRKFNVFRIHPHPVTSQLTAVHHIYVLRRGETTARIQDIAISLDSRWIAVSSEHGTTHVFPITPYGGSVNCRTHVNTDVVNKVSRFERSAGLRDGRGSPLPCSEAPQTPPSPRLPPYPSPNAVAALAQLKARPEDAPLAAIFARPRAWIPGQPRPKRSCSDSLYIIYSSGVFLQYDLVPKTIQSVAKEKKGFDCPIELGVEPKAEWILPKPSYSSNLSPPLPENHVLLELLSLPQPTPDRWLSQVEIMTYTGPSRRLWMGPQFSFSSIDPLPSSGNGGDAATDHIRSNPINIPIKQYFVMEAPFSGSPQLSGSGGLSESGGRLKEDLADAMLETHQSSGQAKGKLRRAEVEWQVNPLGAVQTHPTSLHSNWPHPIFFEQYPEEQYRAVQTPTSQQTVEEAALETIKLEEQSLDSSTPQVLIDTSGNIASEEMSVNTDITSSGWSRVSEDTPNLTICPNVRDVSNISSKSNIEEPLKINSGCLSEFTGDLLEDNMQLIDLNSPSVAITSETDPCSYDKFVAIDQSFNKQEIEGKCEEIVLQMQGAEKKQIDETVSRKKETDDNVHIITKEQETKDTADNVISKKKDTEERVGDVESIKQEIEDKVDILLATLSKKPETKDIVDETVSQQQDIEEKPFKPSGKKGRKKRNGNDKKSKKDPVKLIFHETPFQKENIYDPSNENKINQSVGGFTFKEIIEHKIESSLEQDILLTVGDEQPVLACGLIEVTEEISFIKEETINLANEDYTEPEKEVELNVEIVSENTQLPDTKEEGEIIESSHEISSEHPLLEEPIHKEVIILLPEIKSVQIENECTPVKEVLAVEEDRDLNGNNTFPQVSDCTQELLNSNKTDMGVVIEVPIVVPASENKEVQKCDNIENNECEVIESHSVTENIEQEQVEFITIPTKSNRNKNRRKKKEKKLEEISHVAETSEIESSDSNLIPSDETAGPEPEQVEHSSTNEEEIKVLVDYLTGTKDDIDDLLKNVEIPGDTEINYDNNSLGNEQLQLENSIPDSISLTSLDTKSSLALSDNIHSDALTSTEKSEIDESSHSGKESDDSKVDKKERSRKHKRSESSDKDHSDIKKKSPSPIKSKLEVTKDSESSDEAIQTGDVKLSIPKIPKRKKGKKGEDGNPELPIMETKTSHCSSTDVEESHRLVIKEKGSDCSIESNSETKNPKQTINKCLNQPNAGSDPQNGIDDRDSVYESCNDDGASDSLAFESSKEDFDESTSKFTPTEPSSSNTEEKTDSSDKINQPSKKVRKQKKKKR